jgi:polyisoprenoid-binding protein YceI
MVKTKLMTHLVLGVTLILTACGVAAAVPRWHVDSTQSRLGFTAVQAGAAFDGGFKRFNAEIVFDPGDLGKSRFLVEVDLGSVDTQAEDRDEVLRSADMFDIARWPTARFETSGFIHRSGITYEAEGKLTIRNISRGIRVPFTFEIIESGIRRTARLRGGVALRRLDYGVGRGDLEDTTWVGNDVQVNFSFHLVKE